MTPFESLDKIYNEQVEEADRRNASDRYRIATQEFFDYLERINFHAAAVEYLDGYFIFGTGTNSVIHFHIKECPKWKFGIWWDIDDNDRVKGTFFVRHESDLDKFKPTRSAYCYDICPEWDDSAYYNIDNALNFIKKHPYRAWERTVEYTDFNVEYRTGLKCFWNYYRFVFTKKKCENIEAWLDKKFYKFIEKNILSYVGCEGDEVELRDLGEYVSPRYEITCKIPDDTDFDTGCYSLFEDDDIILSKKWAKAEKKYRKIAEILGTYWYPSCHDCVVYWKECEQEKYNEEI